MGKSEVGQEKAGERATAEPKQETRCYAITGPSSALNGLEALLRHIEECGERGVRRCVSALVEGSEAVVSVRVLASWIEEERAENAVNEWGEPLPVLPESARDSPVFTLDIGA